VASETVIAIMLQCYGKVGNFREHGESRFVQSDGTSQTIMAVSARIRSEGHMTAIRFCASIAILGLAALPSFAQLRSKSNFTTIPAESSLLDQVAITHREAVAKVMKAPTLSTKGTEDAFKAHAAVYSWMIDNPDRVSLAWQRLDVPCVEITAAGARTFSWKDENGSKLTWEPVAKLADGVVWYATGQIKPAALFPMVPVKAVAVLKYPGTATTTPGVSTLKPEIQIYFQTDSKAANALLRLIGPAAPKMAEDAAGQLLYFFSGVAGYLQKHPDQVQSLLAEKKK
jgi:hypothetical protein